MGKLISSFGKKILKVMYLRLKLLRGAKIYLAETEAAGEAKSRASAYIIGQDDPLLDNRLRG